MPWMKTDFSKHTHFRWKRKWRLEHLGALGMMGETAPLINTFLVVVVVVVVIIIVVVVVVVVVVCFLARTFRFQAKR